MRCAHCAKDITILDFFFRVGSYTLCLVCASVEALK